MADENVLFLIGAGIGALASYFVWGGLAGVIAGAVVGAVVVGIVLAIGSAFSGGSGGI